MSSKEENEVFEFKKIVKKDEEQEKSQNKEQEKNGGTKNTSFCATEEETNAAAMAAVVEDGDFEMNDEIAWKMIEKYFLDEPQNLVKHHTESYSDFFKRGIFKIFREKNPITIYSKLDEVTGEYRNRIDIYFGGKDGNKIYFGKPTIYDNNSSHFMFPNEARLRNMNYGMSIHYDIEYETTYLIEEGEPLAQFLGGSRIRDLEDTRESVDFTGKTYLKENATPSGYGAGDEDMEGGGRKPRAAAAAAAVPEMEASIYKRIQEETEKSVKGKVKTKAGVFVEQKSDIKTIRNVFLGKFPIMLQSDFCILSGLSPENKFFMGECQNDYGGYFIIDGKEKIVIPQEKFGNNMMYIEHTNDEKYLYLANIRSVSENASKPIRTLKLGIVSPTSTYKNRQIVVEVPNIRKPVPLFILFRALGVLSDKQIIETCVLDLKKYESIMDLFIPSVHDAAAIMTQESALEYLRTFVKGQNINTVLHVLCDFFLPHVGELNFKEKAYHLGHMVLQLLLVAAGIEKPTDRDNFKFKRVETTGELLYDLFQEYYNIQQKFISLQLEKKVYFSKAQYEDNLSALIEQNYATILKERIVETGFRKAFKGNWGAFAHTKRLGIVQDLNRLSYFSALNHLRKISLPLDSSSKVVGPRLLNSTQWGIIDPIDTPDGGNIGLHKHLTICSCISHKIPREKMILWLKKNCNIELLEDIATPARLAQLTKIFVNGFLLGGVENPEETVLTIRLFRRNGLIPLYTSATFDIKNNTIFVMCDSGRICRPIFYRDEITGKMSYYESKRVTDFLKIGAYSWDNLVMGFQIKATASGVRSAIAAGEEAATASAAAPRKVIQYGMDFYSYDGTEIAAAAAAAEEGLTPNEVASAIRPVQERYKLPFYEEKAVIDYIDTNEEENTFISLSPEELTERHTHLEIHKSLIFGLMCNMIVFPENNPATRNSFSCGQSKQACSLYSTNYQLRMDKMGVLLNHGQIPLVKTRYLDLVNREQNPYGENAIVAIMCYTGYNVEDAILINEGSIRRGMFQTTYFTVYQGHEETAGIGGAATSIRIGNIEKAPGSVIGTKSGFDYSQLDEHGLIKQGTVMNDKRIVIGMMAPRDGGGFGGVAGEGAAEKVYIDNSVVTKKGQLGIVDKTFITDNGEGQRIAKVRIVEQRMPGQGDKFASRAGQKGTIGLIIPESDMPFTRDGIRPDLIINPHALPTRQTIGQLIETLMGKATLMYGGFGDGTAFMNRGPKHSTYGDMLVRQGFHSSGNEVLYNGMTGDQIESEIFIGPTYYMRLKHMVKDKINYRARGPRTMLTRQPVQGRANDGGLRIGEMEANSIMGHGIMEFLTDSMMTRSDKYKMAVCNKTGLIAIYNPERNLFLSPMADGPLKFTGSLDNELRLETVSRFGRDFSVVEVPYNFKLLMQELATINIQMRIITEDNIAQIENLMFGSKNMVNLTGGLETPTQVIEAAQKTVKADTDFVNNALVKIIKETIQELPPEAAQIPPMPAVFEPNTPSMMQPPSSRVSFAAPGENIESPPYAPVESPPYAPVGPAAPMPPSSGTPSPVSSGYEEFMKTIRQEGGGEGAGVGDIREGEMVYLVGGDGRPWKVRTVKPNFVTLEDPMANGAVDTDTIRVVEKFQILRGGGGALAAAEQPQNYFMPSPQFGGGSGGVQQPQAMPNFNIKIFGGSDFSLGAGEAVGGGNPPPPAATAVENTNLLTALSGLTKKNDSAPPQAAQGGSAAQEITNSKDINLNTNFKVVKKE